MKFRKDKKEAIIPGPIQNPTPSPNNDSRLPVAGVLLAAGTSTRFGKDTKQLALINGRPMIEWAVKAGTGSLLDRLVVVIGHDRDNVLRALDAMQKHPKLHIVDNPDYKSGMSSSMKAGLKAVKTHCPAVMFLLADQPLIAPPLINLLIRQWGSSDKNICAPFSDGRTANPVIFGRKYYEDLLKVGGDKGGRDILRLHKEDLLKVPVPGQPCTYDIDTQQDYKALFLSSTNNED